jgi:hypothetical protein
MNGYRPVSCVRPSACWIFAIHPMDRSLTHSKRRRSTARLWSGLLFGWLLFTVFLTGTLTIFDNEITYWMQPE